MLLAMGDDQSACLGHGQQIGDCRQQPRQIDHVIRDENAPHVAAQQLPQPGTKDAAARREGKTGGNQVGTQKGWQMAGLKVGHQS